MLLLLPLLDSVFLSHLLLSALSRCLISALLALLIAPSIANAALLSDLGAPQLFMRTEPDSLQPAPIMKSHLEVVVKGSLASATLTQQFRNPGSEWLHAVYALPLPDQAAVYGWQVDFGDRRLVGVVQERESARRQFAKAVAEVRQAAVVESIDAGLFRVEVGNIEPEAVIDVAITMTWPVDVTGRAFEMRFPTTITPRYRPEHSDNVLTDRFVDPPFAARDLAGVGTDVSDPFLADRTPDWVSSWRHGQSQFAPEPNLPVPLGRAIEFPFTWRVALEPHGSLKYLATPLHNTQVNRETEANRDQDRFILTARRGAAEMDRDFVLRWTLEDSPEPLASILVEEHAGDWFGRLEIIEPTDPLAVSSPPRELTMVVDVSGSMAGESMRQAKAAVHYALSLLKPSDTFNILAFDHRIFALFAAPRHASRDHLAEAEQFVHQLEADGGTEMAPALVRALGQVVDDPHRLSQVLFITDGAVTGEADLHRLISAGLGDTRMSTVAIGPAPNSAFMRRAAQLGRGLYRPIARIADVEPVLRKMMWAMARPVLTDLSIDWPTEVSGWSDLPPDLYQGEPIGMLVKFAGRPYGGVVTVRGTLGGWPWQQDIALPPSAAPQSQAGGVVGRQWARERIQTLLDDASLAGHDMAVVKPVALPLALRFDLVTPFTSLLAQEVSRVRPPDREAGSLRLPTSSPAQRFDYPQTATSAGLWLYFGLLGIFLGVMVIALRSDESLSATRNEGGQS